MEYELNSHDLNIMFESKAFQLDSRVAWHSL